MTADNLTVHTFTVPCTLPTLLLGRPSAKYTKTNKERAQGKRTVKRALKSLQMFLKLGFRTVNGPKVWEEEIMGNPSKVSTRV